MPEEKALSGPDFGSGVSLDELADNRMLQGHIAGERILVARIGSRYFCIGADCTHYGAPLASGIVVDETCVAHGTTLASVCERVMRCAHRRWLQ